VLLTSCVLSDVGAQTGNAVPSSNTIGGYSMDLGMGYAGFSFASDLLNKNLLANGYAGITNQYPSWNLTIIHAIRKNNVFNFGIGGIIKHNTVNDSSKTSFSGFLLNMGIGRVIFHTNNWVVYPMIAYQFGSYSVNSDITGKNSTNDIQATNGNNSVNFSLNADYIFKEIGMITDWDKMKNPFEVFSGKLSFTVGYVLCPNRSFWLDGNTDITSPINKNVNYPTNVIGSLTTSDFSMFYFSVKLGVGVFHKSS